MNRAERRAAAQSFAQQLADPQAQRAQGDPKIAQGFVDLAERANRPKTITLGYCAGDKVHTAWHRALLRTAVQSQQFGFMVRPRDVEAGPNLAPARNMLLKSFLETEDEYFLMVDTDIAFAPQDVAMLLAADAAIAGALYFTAALGSEPWPTALVEGDQETDSVGESPNYVPVTLPTPPEDLKLPGDPDTGMAFDQSPEAAAKLQQENQARTEQWLATLALPIPVAGVGFGLMLIKREVVEKMFEWYPRPVEYADGNGEDLTFCLRAAELGFETVVVPAARVGHLKTVML